MTNSVEISQYTPLPVAIGRSSGWYHPGRSAEAVLLCPAVGFEALCARQSWNALGSILAERGFHVLRFDYPGEGDALDRAADEGLVETARASIIEAAQWLRNRDGVSRLSIVGLRLGATFTCLTVPELGPIHRLALLAPVTSGRAYVREQRMTSKVISEMRPGQEAGPGEINICGFLTSESDVQAIGALTVSLPPAAGQTIVAIEPDRTMPDAFEAADKLEFVGYGRMVQPPTEAVLPLDDFEALANWLAQDIVKTDLAPAVPLAEPILKGDGFVETALRFGEGGKLAGILCEPASGRSETCVHLLNAGANYHIGWARMSVDHARALAREGTASLRYDFTGIGDSQWFSGGPRPYIYAWQHVDDSTAAVDAMAARGFSRHIVAGLCAGGYVAFHAAAQDPRITGSVAANAIRLVWHDHDNLDSLAVEMIQPSAIYKQKLLSGSEWKRLLAGEIGAARIAHILMRYAQKLFLRVARVFSYEPPLSDDTQMVRRKLHDAAKRGVKQSFIHAERDQSRDETERHFGANAVFAARQPGVKLVDIAGADHELTPLTARDQFLAVIRDVSK